MHRQRRPGDRCARDRRRLDRQPWRFRGRLCQPGRPAMRGDLHPDAQPAFEHFQAALGSTFVLVPREERWPTLRRVIEETGFISASNLTRFHTGNPFGPEGYKTIAYELYAQLGGEVPGHRGAANRLRRASVWRRQRLSRAERLGGREQGAAHPLGGARRARPPRLRDGAQPGGRRSRAARFRWRQGSPAP